ESAERRSYEPARRQRSMERTRAHRHQLQARVTSGRLTTRDKIIQAAERILGKNHGQRYYAYQVSPEGVFDFSESDSFEHEKKIEGKYVIITSEKSLSVIEAITLYKDLAELERGFRHLRTSWRCGRSIINQRPECEPISLSPRSRSWFSASSSGAWTKPGSTSQRTARSKRSRRCVTSRSVWRGRPNEPESREARPMRGGC